MRADLCPRPSARRIVADVMIAVEHQIGDDTIVDVALDLMDSVGADELLLHGADGRCSGLLTRAQLGPFRARSWYTARTRVRDIIRDRGAFAGPSMPLSDAAATMKARSLRVWPVVDANGFLLAVVRRADTAAAPAAGS